MHASSSRFVFIAGLLAAVVPGVGSAQADGTDARSPGLMTPYGEYVLLGGGVTDFTAKTEKDRFDVGGTWDARLGFGSRTFIGGEVAYVGSLRNGKASGPDLLGNGAEGVLRLQYPYATGAWLVEPFAFGGIGWSHLSLRNAPAGVTATTDNIGVVPFGAGVTLGYGRFLVDARFTYRTTFNEDLAAAPAASGTADLKQWAVGASIGYEF